jgi:ATP-dependent protease ClpP protease subunit
MKFKTNNEDLNLDLFQHNEQLNYSVSSVVHNKFEFNLDEDIKEPSYYRNLIEVLNNATEQDLVVLNINSGGGMLDSAISIIDALRNTRANTLAWISGSAYSAAGLIALSCQNVEVGEFATLMCHNSQYGLGGYTTDIKDRALFEHKMTSKIMQSVYRFFLSPEEIESVLMNKTLWMDADEIIERLSYMQEKFQEEFEQEMEKMQSEILDGEGSEAPKPKKKKILPS